MTRAASARLPQDVQVPYRHSEHGCCSCLMSKAQRQRHLRQQGPDAERRLRDHGDREHLGGRGSSQPPPAALHACQMTAAVST